MRIVLACALAALVGGCASGPESKPSSVSLETALQSVKDGIALVGEDKGEKKAGLLISEVSVSFNIAASATASDKLMVDLLPGGVIGEIPSGSFERSRGQTEARGNQITFKFQNMMFAGKDTALGIAMTPHHTFRETTTTEGGKTVVEKVPHTSKAITLADLAVIGDSWTVAAHSGDTGTPIFQDNAVNVFAQAASTLPAEDIEKLRKALSQMQQQKEAQEGED